MDILSVITLIGGVAMFLFGMQLMGDNLKKVAGNKLEIILYKLSSTPLKGILLGTGVTAIIQSSSATSVMVVGFVNSKMMKVRQAIGIIMGAVIGTSITGWVICLSAIGGNSSGWLNLLSTECLSAIIAVFGIIMRMFSKKPLHNHVGEILLGFAVLMFGMSTMSGAVSGLKTNPEFLSLMTTFSNPILGILVGIAFTSILQSASAAVGILQALSMTGVITFGVSFSLIMGIAIGAAVPVLLSAIGASTNGRRTAYSYLVVTLIGVIIFAAIFYPLNYFVEFPFMSSIMDVFSIALLNTVFRVINILIAAPFLKQIEKICALMAKDKKNGNGEDEYSESIDRLEERFLVHPALAVEQTRLTMNDMAKTSKESLYDAIALLDNYSSEVFEDVNQRESLVDKYEDKLGKYLVKVMEVELDEKQNKSVNKFLHAITDLERISDHALNIAGSAREKNEKSISFTDDAEKEMAVLGAAICEIMNLAIESFSTDNIELAYRIEPLEEHIDNLCDTMKARHIERIQNGQCTLEHGFVFNDLLTDFERVADHCSNIGVASIEYAKEISGAHQYLQGLKDTHSGKFNEYYNEYMSRYSI